VAGHQLSILLLADDQKGQPDTIHDHIQMFPRYSRHDVQVFNPRGLARSRYLELDTFDVVVIHYSIVVIWDSYLAPWFRETLRRFKGLKVQFLQDEYRHVDAITEMMRYIDVDILYSVVPPHKVGEVYGDRLPDTEILPTLTGYVPERLVGLRTPPLDVRPIDVGYRGRSLPYWLGRLGSEKIEIGRAFLTHAHELGLRADIAWTEGARIYGDRWNEFIRSCRAMLASESGSSIIDYDGSVERAVRGYLAEHPGASYDEVDEAVLRSLPPSPEINTLSPRLFEAAAQRTAMIMFPGEYSGAVHPWKHYIPLGKGFENVIEVAARVRDTPFLQQLTARAYEDLIAEGRFSEQGFIAEFDEQVAARAVPRYATGRPHHELLLKLEQAAVGRGYQLSRLYGMARDSILAYLGIKNALRTAPLRRLLRYTRREASSPGATSLWDDLFRLAILTSVQRGLPVLAGEQFHVIGRYDTDSNRLTLTSRPGDGAGPPDRETIDDVADAARARCLREIIWSHATLEQYVPLRFGPTGMRVAFDVGRYDAYGVYRFDALAELARERPNEVIAALTPLVAKPGSGDAAYSVTDKRGSKP
jgi:hypothetical protein